VRWTALVRPPHRLNLCSPFGHTSSFVRCCYLLVAVSLLVAHADCRAASYFMALIGVVFSRRKTQASIHLRLAGPRAALPTHSGGSLSMRPAPATFRCGCPADLG